MNSLNSVLLEGEVVSDTVEDRVQKSAIFCSFIISSSRIFKKDEKVFTEESLFNVEAHSTLAEKCSANLQAGTGIRVVGRLKQVGSNVVIIAEHLEIKSDKRS